MTPGESPKVFRKKIDCDKTVESTCHTILNTFLNSTFDHIFYLLKTEKC